MSSSTSNPTPSKRQSHLDALIAAASPANTNSGTRPPRTSTPPNRPLLELAQATRAIAGWYEYALGVHTPNPNAPRAQTSGPVDLEQVVQHHVAVRREWEQREALNLVAWMSAQADAAMRKTAQRTAEKSAGARRRALLIDDSADILVTVGAFLESYGFDVIAVSDGEAALRMIGEQQVHLLVTDHAMPGMTGRDLVLQACNQDQALRAMIITGYPELHELKSLPAGIAVLAKPFRRAELFSRLRTLFAKPAQSLEAGMSGTFHLSSL